MMCSTVVLLVSATLVAGVSSYFDIEDEFQLLEPPNTHLIGAPQCRTASLFALIGALEIAQQRTTGIQINFSEQEIIDCQYSGCMGASLEEYVNWLAVHDRLAPADHYNAYRARQFPCSSALAPDALSQIKVAGVKHIQLEEFEEAIARYGSVLACIDTSSSSCPVYRVYEDGIINGFASDKCNHRVLVVGYNEKYYRVRNSYGPDWGEEGYFRILRGGNVCGIESHLAVLEIEERIETKKVDNVTGCPRTYPVYCNATKTCRSKKQTCVEIDERAMAAEQHEEVLRDRESRLQQNSRNIRNALCEDNPSYSCSALSAYCQVQKIQSICPATCQVCTSACIDVEEYDGECEELREFCTHSNAVKAKCAYTCGMDPQDCGTVTENVNLLVKYNRPPLGECYKPRVKNGKVLNKGRLTTGQKLVILCAPGYVLSGEANYCQIQNIYKPDSRRLQTCVPTAGEAFTGQGMDYSGTVSTTVGGEKCDNWQKLAHLGIFDSIEQGRSLGRVGNHNFCRNYKEDLMGPWCLVNGRRSYCFAFPGCGGDLCSSHNMQNSYPYCTSSFTGQECALSHSGRENKVAWYWKNCRHMCCAASGC